MTQSLFEVVYLYTAGIDSYYSSIFEIEVSLFVVDNKIFEKNDCNLFESFIFYQFLLS